MEKRTFSKTFSLTFQEWDQLQKIMEKTGALSPSEVVRNIVRVAFQKEFPDYIYNRSATDVAKRATLEKNTDVETMSDLEYARKYLPGGLYFEGKNVQDGEFGQYYLIFDDQGYIRPWKLANVKRYYESQKNHVNAHRERAKDELVSQALDANAVKLLREMWLIDVPEHYTDQE